MSNSTAEPVVCIPQGEDPLAYAATRVFARAGDNLPRLLNIHVLVPDLQATPRLRHALSQQAQRRGHDALLGPHIHTFRGWIEACPLPEPPRVKAAGRELILVEAVEHYRHLFSDADPWRLAVGLLELFDELTRYGCAATASQNAFVEAVSRGYGVAGPRPQHMEREAQLVFTLWQAWHQQLSAEQLLDPEAAYQLALEQSLARIRPDEFFFLVGFPRLTPNEARWVRTLLERDQAEIIFHGSDAQEGLHPDAPIRRCVVDLGRNAAHSGGPRDAYPAFLETVFGTREQELRVRARKFRAEHPASPVPERLSLFSAIDSEQEAQTVEFQVRQWLVQGHREIGIVTEDRRLARRIRALLERAGISLRDTGGWALSTTSAAAVVERWLETLEEDFAHEPLLDVLKSPFMLPDEEPERHRHTVFRFERDLIVNENIARGLDRYRRHMEFRRTRLDWPEETTAAATALLDRLATAAQPLTALRDGSKRDPSRFLDELQRSLAALGVWTSLLRDPAGQRLAEELERMRAGAAGRSLQLDWNGFRQWLAQRWESTHFRPATASAPVQLLNLEQSCLGRFDALVIAGAERESFPGRRPDSPYFNDRVRAGLSLPTWERVLSERLYHFRRLLEAAPRVLISYRREQDGDPIVPSPWVEALDTFHHLAYGAGLSRPGLAARVKRHRLRIPAQDLAPAPRPSPAPRPPAPATRLPGSLSVRAHQRLIDCPYQFFAAECLGLQPPEQIREVLEKSDYGERVHQCLQAFHRPVDKLPGPYTGPLDPAHRAQAIQKLETISRARFAQDLEDNFVHRGWLRRWLELIPAYVDWEIRRQKEWHVHAAEYTATAEVTGGWSLRGRLDRVDRAADGGLAVVDYKTGQAPSGRDVIRGEAVQLPSYALLQPGTRRVEYLKLDEGVAKSLAALEGDELEGLRQATQARLGELWQALRSATPLPAWGDEATCARCPMSGICRRQAWETELDGPSTANENQ